MAAPVLLDHFHPPHYLGSFAQSFAEVGEKIEADEFAPGVLLGALFELFHGGGKGGQPTRWRSERLPLSIGGLNCGVRVSYFCRFLLPH